MMKKIDVLTAILLAAGTLAGAVSGCELIASVDRTKLPGATGGASTTTGSGGTTTSTMATGGTGGMGGTGGLPSLCGVGSKTCMADSACPTPSSKCILPFCVGGCCSTKNAVKGTACTDNGGNVCNGDGTCIGCFMASDCPATGTVCKTNTCDMTAHTCGSTSAPVGVACTNDGGVVCDGKGGCTPSHCMDGTQDADETDVDCGGSCGPTCKDTSPQQHCMVGGDCVNGVCASMLCQPPTCSDGVKNGSETDVDCGGGSYMGAAACAPCPDTKHCAVNADCANTFCFGTNPGTCVSCMDGVKDGNETDIDCGGPQCDAITKTCDGGQGCKMATDCSSAPPCNGKVFTPASTCNGSNVCVTGTAVDCSATGDVCNATSGCVQCNTDADCMALDGGILDGGALDGSALDGGALDGSALDGGMTCTNHVCM
jgi:hypothetical protein